MDSESFVLSFTEGSVSDEYLDLSNLDTPIKTNSKVAVKFNQEFGSNVTDGIIGLQSKTYSFKKETSKEKGTKNENNGNYKD